MLLSSVNRPLLIYLRSVKSRMSVRLRKIVAYSLPEKRGEVLLTRKLDFEGHGPPLSVMKSWAGERSHGAGRRGWGQQREVRLGERRDGLEL